MSVPINEQRDPHKAMWDTLVKAAEGIIAQDRRNKKVPL